MGAEERQQTRAAHRWDDSRPRATDTRAGLFIIDEGARGSSATLDGGT